ncbi:MAG: YbjQ family protein [Alphaproteobacteria bacterium]|nr:YbjQ family protein [Alphaproteobacteria bacterium]
MLVTTTDVIDGQRITAYLGLVTGEAVIGVNVFRDLFSGLRDFFGGRSGSLQSALQEARTEALNDLIRNAQSMGAEAVIGCDLDYQVLGSRNGMLMVAINGTAVRLSR